MKISPSVFEAFLKCPTKSWLRFTAEPTSGNEYAEWVQTENESYRAEAARQMMAAGSTDQTASPSCSSRREEAHYSSENLKTAKWRFAFDVPIETDFRNSRGHETQTTPPENDQSLLTSAATIVETRLHAVERIPSAGRGKAAQFIPIRFIYRNKLTKNDKLLLAHDAFVLSQLINRPVTLGKIIHGDDHSTLKVKTSALADDVRKRLEKIADLLSIPTPPDLVLNRHCCECEFQARCRKLAVEKDDLSLLANMSVKERQKFRSKGIFTVTQLSYTFRPRRRPKRQSDKKEKYHHSLKALAIREQKIHIVGSPELKIEGTPVYLDVEGLPDRDFYYLIGLRIGSGDPAVQHSLWADTISNEGKIWREFLAILETVEKPVLIHYGSYETTFLKLMKERHGKPQDESVVAKAIASTLNLVSMMFAQVYFPTYSNGLKEIAGWIGYQWSKDKSSGLRSICWRHEWEQTGQCWIVQTLLKYNLDDCAALELIINTLLQVNLQQPTPTTSDGPVLEITLADALPSQDTMWPKFASPIGDFEPINKAGRWDYQRDRVYVRTDRELKRATAITKIRRKRIKHINKIIEHVRTKICPECQTKTEYRKQRIKTLYDVRFTECGIRRWVVMYHIKDYRCITCHRHFGAPKVFWNSGKFGRNLVAYVVFQVIELCIPQHTVADSMNRLFRLGLAQCTINNFKSGAARYYDKTRQMIVGKMVNGEIIHADETRIALRDQVAYVWVFVTFREVVYFYSETREGDLLEKLLKEFKGVLVSDFYAVYDSTPC